MELYDSSRTGHSAVNYEGRAAIELKSICDIHSTQKYNFQVTQDGSIIGAQRVIREAVADIANGVPAATVSARFHLAVADLIATMARTIRAAHRSNRVMLSGGVFQYAILLKLLQEDRFEVFIHQQVPPNDGGLSLGQAAIANARIAAGKF